MSYIPGAEQSPRIENGVMKWYTGNNFDLVLTLELKDASGNDITIASGDTIKVSFYNKSLTKVKEFMFNSIVNNTVTMNFDATCTALFPAGKYTYDITYTSNSKTTTVASDNKVVVE